MKFSNKSHTPKNLSKTYSKKSKAYRLLSKWKC